MRYFRARKVLNNAGALTRARLDIMCVSRVNGVLSRTLEIIHTGHVRPRRPGAALTPMPFRESGAKVTRSRL